MNPLTLTTPPSPRDFEIFEHNQIHFRSTRRLADKHGISQTRIRQIVTRVATWLAAQLPAQTEADREAETRLAQHLAAAQLRRQLEELQNYFDGTGDPKYLRHQTRVIASLARLGVVPGALDSLAADATDLPTDSCPLSPEPCSPPPAPSPRDCSPSPPTSSEPTLQPTGSASRTPDHAEPSDEPGLSSETFRQGLDLMERRLLTLLDDTPTDNRDRRSSLERSLAAVRRSRATLELQTSPNHPGVRLSPVP